MSEPNNEHEQSGKREEERLAAHTINDPESFRVATGRDHAIAALYAYSQLDVLIDLAHLVSIDFFARPEKYQELAHEDLPPRIAALHARYGCDERLLDQEQRRAVYAPLFSGPADDFVKYRDPLLTVATKFAEWGQATGIPMLRADARTAHLPFKQQLQLFNGAAVRWSRDTVLPYLSDEVAYPILRDRGVASVFGVYRPPGEVWPYRPDANGDQLVEEISRRLDPGRAMPLTRHRFSLCQRAALRGAEAIAAVLDYSPHRDDEYELDQLIARCYTWHTALRDLGETASTATSGPGSMAAASPNGDREVAAGLPFARA